MNRAILGVKLGHRRTLFRQIATLRGMYRIAPTNAFKIAKFVGHPQTEPLDEAHQAVPDYMSYQSIDDSQRASMTGSCSEGLVSPSVPLSGIPQKRRYKRHPKADENAPPRPASAYVLFANQVREQQKDSDLNFAQLARLVGDRWKNLVVAEKESIELRASDAKKQYNTAVINYKRSNEYQLYQDYLVEFKERALKDDKPEKLEPPKKAQRLNIRDASEMSLMTYGASRPVDPLPQFVSQSTRPFLSIPSILRDPRDIVDSASCGRLPPPPRHSPDFLVSPSHAPESYSRQSHLPYPLALKPLSLSATESPPYKVSVNQLPRLRDDPIPYGLDGPSRAEDARRLLQH